MRAHLGMISLFAVALTLFTGTAWSETPTTGKPAPSAKKKASACDRHAFRAVIDVGHTLAVGGATSARGIYEYEFNLRLAKQIANELTSAGFDKTDLLITTEPAHSALFRRSSRANAMGADLFLSIHHDSVPDPMLEKWTYDGAERMAVAGRGLLFRGWCRLSRGRRLAPCRAREERQSYGEKRELQMCRHAERPHIVICSSASARWTAGRCSIRSLNAV